MQSTYMIQMVMKIETQKHMVMTVADIKHRKLPTYTDTFVANVLIHGCFFIFFVLLHSGKEAGTRSLAASLQQG